MRGIVRAFGGGAGTIAPRDGSPDLEFSFRVIQGTSPKILTAGDEVHYEQDSGGAVTVVFLVH